MRRKNKYGETTAQKCFVCDNIATTTNMQGIAVCTKCKDKTIETTCPLCKSVLEPRTVKFGDYFYCWRCNTNWSKYKLERFRK